MRQIKVQKNGNSCILRWTYQDERYSLTWGAWEDTSERARLDYCGKLIYQDCLIGQFDPTLNKYKLWLQGITYGGNGGSKPPESRFPPLIEMLQLRIADNYNSADQSLLKLLQGYKKQIKTSVDAKEFLDWLDGRGIKKNSKKRYLAILQVLRKDLFGSFQVKVPDKPRAKPLTTNEVDMILSSLQRDPFYNHYHDFILLLLNTGLRLSEAIGLRWQDIDLQKREIHVYETLNKVKGRSSKRVRKTTKTNVYRIVPMNSKVYQILKVRSEAKNKQELIFTSPKGLPLDDHNIGQRCWKITLENLGIPHRPLYVCRSTFISHCISSGIPPHEVADLVGNSPEIIFRHYLGSIKKPKLPEL